MARSFRSLSLPALLCALVFAYALQAPLVRAASVLTLTMSSPDNLSNLSVGDSFTVNVALSGLDPNEHLITLTSGIDFSTVLLSAPSAVTSGAIVPNPLADPLDFQIVANPGQADASFVTFSNDAAKQISAEGLFYSFKLKAQAEGSGQITFDSLALIGEGFAPPDHNLRTVVGANTLNYTIKSAGPPGVPLPAAVWGGLALLGGLALVRLSRRLRRFRIV